MWGWSDNTMGGGGWVVMVLGMVIFWSLVIFVVATMFRGNRNDNGATGTPRRDPMDILDERFAQGEIDAEEYQIRRDALRRVS